MRPIFDALRKYHASIISVLSSHSEGGEDERNVYVRIRPMEQAQEETLIADLKKRFNLVYWAREEVYVS
jgi:acetoin utilization protein AcuB